MTVTDSANYEIVDLSIGDTKTYVDKTGNYADSSLEGLDRNVAEDVYKRQGQLACILRFRLSKEWQDVWISKNRL